MRRLLRWLRLVWLLSFAPGSLIAGHLVQQWRDARAANQLVAETLRMTQFTAAVTDTVPLVPILEYQVRIMRAQHGATLDTLRMMREGQ